MRYRGFGQNLQIKGENMPSEGRLSFPISLGESTTARRLVYPPTVVCTAEIIRRVELVVLHVFPSLGLDDNTHTKGGTQTHRRGAMVRQHEPYSYGGGFSSSCLEYAGCTRCSSSIVYNTINSNEMQQNNHWQQYSSRQERIGNERTRRITPVQGSFGLCTLAQFKANSVSMQIQLRAT